jgi:hypothetical protein
MRKLLDLIDDDVDDRVMLDENREAIYIESVAPRRLHMYPSFVTHGVSPPTRSRPKY